MADGMIKAARRTARQCRQPAGIRSAGVSREAFKVWRLIWKVTQKDDLPAGKVEVTVTPVAEPVQPERFWAMMESIWATQLASGQSPALGSKSTPGSRRCETNLKTRCRLSNVFRKNLVGPGSQSSRLVISTHALGVHRKKIPSVVWKVSLVSRTSYQEMRESGRPTRVAGRPRHVQRLDDPAPRRRGNQAFPVEPSVKIPLKTR